MAKRFYKFKGNIGLDNPNFIRDIEMIRNDEIWCSEIKDLNDPAEASYSLYEFTRNLSNGSKFFSFLGIKRYNQNNINSYKNALEKVMNLHSEYCGVYSLSGNYNNELMWAHYPNSHKGFCIEYDFENLKDFDLQFPEQNPLSHLHRFGKINYSDTLFQISCINPNYDDIIKFLFFKSKIWSYEEEYRIITNIAGKFKYNAKCIKSISFGLNMKDAEKSFIISNLRDSDGLWENHSVTDVASPEGWRKDRALVLEFYNQRRRQLHEVQPNDAHKLIADLEKYFDVQIVTQNIDDLHERAGSTNILHIHGELFKSCSCNDKSLVYEQKSDINLGDKAEDGAQLRPFIVWFGEDVPLYQKAQEIVKNSDILLVIGTSLQVYPAAGLIHEIKDGCMLIVINPNETEFGYGQRAVVMKETATKGMELLFEKLVNLG